MKYVLLFLIGLWCGIVSNDAYLSHKRATIPGPAITHITDEVIPNRDIRVELSIGGIVRPLTAQQDSVIHIIADDDGRLTDVQVLPDNPVINPYTNGQQSNQTASKNEPTSGSP